MILPTKHVPTKQSLIGVGALVLQHLERERTLTDLWERVHKVTEVGTFKRLVLTLDLLYAIGAIEIGNGLLRRARP
jgi:hypothetical protein